MNKAETTWQGTLNVTVTPVGTGQNEVTFSCEGQAHNCKGSCSFDSEGNLIGCQIRVLSNN